LKFVYYEFNNKYKHTFLKLKSVSFKYNIYFYKKFLIKSRKQIARVKYKFKNNNLLLVHKFLCISMKSGNKITLFKHFELFFRNYLTTLYYNEESENIEDDGFYLDYIYYKIIRILIRKKSFFFNFNKLLMLVLPAYETLFSIKVKKLNKKLRLKYKKKYINTINYVPYEKRNNLTLKFLNVQSFSVKSFKLYERWFKVLLMSLLHPFKTFPWRRREVVYEKILLKYKKLK